MAQRYKPAVRYVLRQKFAPVASFSVETYDGAAAYQVQRTPLANEVTFLDMAGTALASVVRTPLALRPTFEIQRPGRPTATLTGSFAWPLHRAMAVEVDGVEVLNVKGNLFGLEYTLSGPDGAVVASISHEAVLFSATYEIDVVEGADPLQALCVTIAIDMAKPRHRFR